MEKESCIDLISRKKVQLTRMQKKYLVSNQEEAAAKMIWHSHHASMGG